MKKFFNSLTKNAATAATIAVLAFLILPLKVFVVLAIAYCIAHATGVFKLKFPDIWELQENFSNVKKSHKTFLSAPTRINGKIYLFCYVNRVIIYDVTSYSFGPIPAVNEDTSLDGNDTKVDTIN